MSNHFLHVYGFCYNVYAYKPFSANGFYEQPPGFVQAAVAPADLWVKIVGAVLEFILKIKILKLIWQVYG